MNIRDEFPVTQNLAYLDHAAAGPLSITARKAFDWYLDERQFRNPSNYEGIFPILERCRARLGEILNVPAGRIELTTSTSTALHVLTLGLDWQKGDRVAVPDCEFPANVMPWKGLADQSVEVDFIPHTNGIFRLDDVERVLTPQTRVLAISWVQFLSGYRVDMAEISALCRSRGILLSLDAIQGLGALQLDLQETPVDFLACGAQKWLMGLPGAAFFYVSEALQNQLTPVRGWLNGPVDFENLLAYDETLHDDALRFRIGTMPMGELIALEAALSLYQNLGMELAERRVLELSAYAANELDRLGLERFGSADPRYASGIVTVRHPNANRLPVALAQAGVRASVRNGMLRVSPTWYNNTEDIDRLLDVVRETL